MATVRRQDPQCFVLNRINSRRMDVVLVESAILALSAGAYIYERVKSHRYKKKFKAELAHEQKEKDFFCKLSESSQATTHEWITLADHPCLAYTYEFDIRNVYVVGVKMGNPKVSVILKSFPYDYRDLDDYEFAVREAKELIEKLTE